jgi:hypothetical protein
MAAEVRARREPGPYELVAELPAGTDPAPWIEAGATWCLMSFGIQPTEAELRAAIEAG